MTDRNVQVFHPPNNSRGSNALMLATMVVATPGFLRTLIGLLQRYGFIVVHGWSGLQLIDLVLTVIALFSWVAVIPLALIATIVRGPILTKVAMWVYVLLSCLGAWPVLWMLSK